MARTLSSTNYLSVTTPADPGGAGTIWCRFKPSWNATDSVAHFPWLYYNTGSVSFLMLNKHSDNVAYIGVYESGADKRITASAAGFVNGVWANHLYTWNDATESQQYYVNNSFVNSVATAFTMPTGFTALHLGSNNGASGADGDLAEWARWDRVLSIRERAVVEATCCPLNVPRGLIRYYPLIGRQSPETELMNGQSMTLVGTPTAADHPRVFYPSAPNVLSLTVPAAPGAQDLFLPLIPAVTVVYGQDVAEPSAQTLDLAAIPSATLLYGPTLAEYVETVAPPGRTAIVPATSAVFPDIPVFYKDADDTLDFSIDWGENWLIDDTISTSTWIVPLGIEQEGTDTLSESGITTIWLKGGLSRRSYEVTNRISTDGGRIKDWILKLVTTKQPGGGSAPSNGSGGIDGGTP